MWYGLISFFSLRLWGDFTKHMRNIGHMYCYPPRHSCVHALGSAPFQVWICLYLSSYFVLAWMRSFLTVWVSVLSDLSLVNIFVAFQSLQQENWLIPRRKAQCSQPVQNPRMPVYVCVFCKDCVWVSALSCTASPDSYDSHILIHMRLVTHTHTHTYATQLWLMLTLSQGCSGPSNQLPPFTLFPLLMENE